MYSSRYATPAKPCYAALSTYFTPHVLRPAILPAPPLSRQSHLDAIGATNLPSYGKEQPARLMALAIPAYQPRLEPGNVLLVSDSPSNLRAAQRLVVLVRSP